MCLEPSEGVWSRPHLALWLVDIDFGLLASRTVRKYIPIVGSHSVSHDLLQWP